MEEENHIVDENKNSNQHIMKKITIIRMSVVSKVILKLINIDTKKGRWKGATLFDTDGTLERE